MYPHRIALLFVFGRIHFTAPDGCASRFEEEAFVKSVSVEDIRTSPGIIRPNVQSVTSTGSTGGRLGEADTAGDRRRRGNEYPASPCSPYESPKRAESRCSRRENIGGVGEASPTSHVRHSVGGTGSSGLVGQETFLESLKLDVDQMSEFLNSEGHFLYLRQKTGTDATSYNLEVG